MEKAGLLRNENGVSLLNFRKEKFKGVVVTKYGDASVLEWSVLSENNYK